MHTVNRTCRTQVCFFFHIFPVKYRKKEAVAMKDEYRDSYQQFGLNVVYYRKKKRLSQTQLAELVDIQAELDRINKEIEKAKNGLRIVEGKLSNEKFVSKAPEAVVNAEKEKAAKYAELIAKLEESAKAMQA